MNTLTNSHWDAVIALLRLACPAVTRERLEAMLGGAGRIARAKITPGKVLYSRQDIRRMLAR